MNRQQIKPVFAGSNLLPQQPDFYYSSVKEHKTYTTKPKNQDTLISNFPPPKKMFIPRAVMN